MPQNRTIQPSKQKLLLLLRINHIKTWIDKTQQKCRFRLYGERDEMNTQMSECSKLAQKKNKSRHDWMGKLINWDLSQKLKFDHTIKWYMHDAASVLENETHISQWDFEIQTDHWILIRRQNLLIINKKKRTCRVMDFAVHAYHSVKLKESKNKKSNSPCLVIFKKSWNMTLTIIPIIGSLRTVTK